MEFFAAYNTLREKFDTYFAACIDALDADIPPQLRDSMRYALKSRGKRLRPVLFLHTAALYGADCEAAYRFAAAIEALHTYTLVHDDLPSIDNDAYRRGRLTTHRVYGEDIALLAGDALLNLAYEWIFKAIETAPNRDAALSAASFFAGRCGGKGLIGGQTMDVAKLSEGELSAELLGYIYQHKTADLIAAATLSGAIFASAPQEDCAALTQFSYAFGFAFQLSDDLLDAASSNRGTSALDLYSETTVKNMRDSYTDTAVTALAKLSRDTDFFSRLAAGFAERKV